MQKTHDWPTWATLSISSHVCSSWLSRTSPRNTHLMGRLKSVPVSVNTQRDTAKNDVHMVTHLKEKGYIWCNCNTNSRVITDVGKKLFIQIMWHCELEMVLAFKKGQIYYLLIFGSSSTSSASSNDTENDLSLLGYQVGPNSPQQASTLPAITNLQVKW